MREAARPSAGGTGGYEGPGRKGMRLGGIQMVLSATRAGWFTYQHKNSRPPRLLVCSRNGYYPEIAVGGGRRRFWHGLWYGYGVGP
jgi:hypothetical protein